MKNKLIKKITWQGIIIGAAASLVLVSAGSVLSAKIQTAAIKPQAKGAVLSDEQQSIVAVRNAKASVVSIVGTNAPEAAPTSSQASISAFTPETVEGTGFIVAANGLIVTNSHVVDDTSFTYTVIFNDGTQYAATVKALDKYDDIAILTIPASGLPVATLGDSGSLETGQTVFAIGNSLGKYQDSVTKGVVSGLGRAVAEPNDTGTPIPRLQDLIQTDAAINPGNSGGPLIDMSGSVVGMNTLIDTEGSSLGFAIPINTIKSAISQLQNFGRVAKPYVGLTFSTITSSVKQLNHLSVPEGALIAGVTPGGPAAAAGLQTGDVITAINHVPLTETNELDTVVGAYAPGTQVLVTYLRGGQSMDAPLILGQF